MDKRNCIQCTAEFYPKPKGYNAKYCCDRCKKRNQRERLRKNNPDQLIQNRARSYQKTKDKPYAYQRHLEQGRSHTAATRKWLADYKLSEGCIDCGYKVNSVALQLDHEGIKSVAISDARSSIKRLQNEIELGKCVVRCANCHAVKTAERRVMRTTVPQ